MSTTSRARAPAHVEPGAPRDVGPLDELRLRVVRVLALLLEPAVERLGPALELAALGQLRHRAADRRADPEDAAPQSAGREAHPHQRHHGGEHDDQPEPGDATRRPVAAGMRAVAGDILPTRLLRGRGRPQTDVIAAVDTCCIGSARAGNFTRSAQFLGRSGRGRQREESRYPSMRSPSAAASATTTSDGMPVSSQMAGR